MIDERDPVSKPVATGGQRPGLPQATFCRIGRVFERFRVWWLCLIILVGFGIRLSGLSWGQGYSYFGQGDAVEAYEVAVKYGHGEEKAQYLGQPNYNSKSKLPGPLWTLFCFSSYRFWGSIEGVIFTIILLNSAVIYLNYELAKRTIGPAAGLWTALFTAVSPWAVYYSNGLYNPDLMAFLSALLFLALWKAVAAPAAASIFWVPIVLLLLPQVHMSGLLLIPAVVIVLLLSPSRINVPCLIAGSLAALALYFPYFHGELNHQWQNTRGMFGGGGGGYTAESFKAISAPLSFLVNWGPRWSRTAAEYKELGRACFGSFGIFLSINIISAAVAGLVIVGAFLEVKAKLSGFWRSPRIAFGRSPGIGFLSVLFLVPLLIATASGKPFHTRYCVVLLPVLFPLAALGTRNWVGNPSRVSRLFVFALAVTCCADVWLMPAMYHHQRSQIEQARILIPSFRQLGVVYQSMKDHAGSNSAVRVETARFLESLRPEEKSLREARWIRRYVAIREREAEAATRTSTVAVYELRRSESVAAEDPAVAYRGHGIALVLTPP